MNILPEQTFAQIAAVKIQAAIDEVIAFNRAKLTEIYQLVNTPGQEQAVMDELGTNAAIGLQAYTAFQQDMELVAPGSVPAADPSVFLAQEDGTVVYAAPPTPEIPGLP